MDRNPRNARENLPRLRQLVKDGLLKEAEDLVFKSFLGTPESMRHYEVGGEAMFTFHHGKGHVDHYKRWLDLDQSLLGVEYRVGDVDFRREIFASNPHGIMFANFTSSHEGSLAFDMRLFRGEETNVYVDSVEVRDGIMHLSARTGGGGVTLCISVMVKVRQGWWDEENAHPQKYSLKFLARNCPGDRGNDRCAKDARGTSICRYRNHLPTS